jgi:cellulose synthase/poly-beta-1,6-N-acetylglucosamine synthase-like glycosyltransferase
MMVYIAQAIFWCSALVLAYTYIGYPFIIWLFARVRPRCIKKSKFVPSVTIILVVYNEERLIRNKLNNCLGLAYPKEKLNILVISDGSTDATKSLVESYVDKGIHLLAFAQRRGKAACINDAVAACSTDYIIFTDVRQRFAEDAIEKLMSNFADPQVGAVSGELLFDEYQHTAFSKGVDIYWRYEKFIRYHESIFDSVVGVTGAIYALKALFKNNLMISRS